MTPRRIKQLEDLASRMVGDSESPNLFFVTHSGSIVTITRYYTVARDHFLSLTRLHPRDESALEDRMTGVVSDHTLDEETKRFVTYDHGPNPPSRNT